MHLDRWKDILDQINEHFDVEDQGVVESEEQGGSILEYIIFNGAIGKIKLEFVSKPKVIDKKVTYSNRIGSDVAIEYIYSPSEKVYTFFAYKWSEADNDWLPLDNDSFNLF